MAPNEEKRMENCEETTDIPPNESDSSTGTQKRSIQEIGNDEKEKLLAYKKQLLVYKSRKEIIQKYGYSEFAIWFQEESFFNYWQVHGFGGVPLYQINLAKRRKLRGEKFKKEPSLSKLGLIDNEINNKEDKNRIKNTTALKKLAELMQKGNLTVEVRPEGSKPLYAR